MHRDSWQSFMGGARLGHQAKIPIKAAVPVPGLQ